MKQLLVNWKTTSAGLTIIIGSTVHLIFGVLHGAADENTWTTSLLAIATGIGLMFAGDAAASAQAHSDSQAQIADLKAKVELVPLAISTGDTSVLQKANVATATTPPIPIALPPKSP